MAHIQLDESHVNILLNPIDEVLSLHGSLHIPLAHIRGVRHERVPDEWFRGFRLGTNLPGVKVAGTFLTGEGMIFYDFHDPAHCLIFDLVHEHYRHVIVEVDENQDPDDLARRVSALLH